MNSASGQIRLRLVGDGEEGGGDARAVAAPGRGGGGAPLRPVARAVSEAEARARAAIARENRSAAAMAATDARWVVAVRVAESLEGGRLAILRPEKRRHITALATRLGLRPFDANLIIAIVQDSARVGNGPVHGGRGALGPDTVDRLRLVREAEGMTERGRRRAAWLLLWTVLLGLGMAAVAVRWVVGR